MQQLLLIAHVLVCIFLVMLVLVQQGKGATMGASFGSGASQTVFGSQGSGSFLFKLTALFGALFFATCIGIGYEALHAAKQQAAPSPLTQTVPLPTTTETPVVPNQPQDKTNKSVGSQKIPSQQ